MTAIYVVAVIVGQALGYALVRLFVWAWPSIWQLMRPEGRAWYRELLGLILHENSAHSVWRAHYYAFVDARHCR